MTSTQKQITRLLRHLKQKPGDKQARAKLYDLGYHEPPSSILPPVQFEAMLKNLYQPSQVTEMVYRQHPLFSAIPKEATGPATVWFPKSDEDARKLGYGIAYVVVKRG